MNPLTSDAILNLCIAVVLTHWVCTNSHLLRAVLRSLSVTFSAQCLWPYVGFGQPVAVLKGLLTLQAKRVDEVTSAASPGACRGWADPGAGFGSASEFCSDTAVRLPFK